VVKASWTGAGSCSRPARSAGTWATPSARRSSGTALVRTTEVRAEDFPAGRRSRSRATGPRDHIHRIGDKQAAIHVIRYDYDEERDEVPVIGSMHIDVRLSRPSGW